MSVPLYNDVHKRANDLLTKDFPSTFKVELKAPKEPGLGLDSSISEKEGTMVGVFTPKYQLEKSETYGTTVFSVSVDSKRNLKAEVTATDLLTGLKTTLTFTDSPTVTGVFEYKHPNFSSNATLNLMSPKGATGILAAVLGYQGHAFGLHSEFNVSSRTFTDINASVAINTDTDVSLGLYARIKKNILGARLYYRYEDNLAIAAEAEANYQSNAEVPKFTLASEYFLDARNILKCKVDTAGNIGVAFISKLSDRVKAAIATTINTNGLSPVSKTSYGISFTIE